MRHSKAEYKGFTILKRVDIPTDTAMIYKGDILKKCIAGDIAKDGSENSLLKAKQ